MYCLEAAMAGEPVLRKLAGAVRGACVVPLGQHVWLLPMTEEIFEVIAGAGAPTLDGFWTAPAGFGGVLAACSTNGPVAYVEAEFFGGTGMQSAQVWHRGKVIFGPLHVPEDEPSPAAGTPISQALRQLGVTKGSHVDEFAAVGLDRHRSTKRWLPPTS